MATSVYPVLEQRNALHILIAGAGIAGCAAAISLARNGHRVTMIEKQEEWRFLSSGIFVYSNGLESLRALGVLNEILEAGFAIPGGRNRYLDHLGKHIVDVTYPEGGGGVPAILGIKRAELHRILAERLDCLGVKVRLGTQVKALDNRADGPRVMFSDGTVDDFDLLIGADGISSSMRSMAGFTEKPVYSGFGVWRSVHVRPDELTDKIMMMGPGKRFGIMPISNDRLYTFGTIAEPSDTWFDPDHWVQTMRQRFAEFGGVARHFIDEIDENSEVFYTAVQEVQLPLPWHRGRVVLIGDAAHASTPFMGQGGAMAMEDGIILAELLDACEDVDTALEQFGEIRFPVCSFVQDVSRRVGEAGANEDAATLSGRDERMQREAQAAVTGFYGQLNMLRDAAAEKISAMLTEQPVPSQVGGSCLTGRV